jgi:hypothetical protein
MLSACEVLFSIRHFAYGLHGAITQMMAALITTAVRTPNSTLQLYCLRSGQQELFSEIPRIQFKEAAVTISREWEKRIQESHS